MRLIPPHLQCLLLDNYQRLETSQEAEDHMLGDHSELVFRACLPLLPPPALHSLLSSLALCSVLARLSGHESYIRRFGLNTIHQTYPRENQCSQLMGVDC